jgi:hypothetical protein
MALTTTLTSTLIPLCPSQTIFACFAYSPLTMKMHLFDVSSLNALYRDRANKRIRMTPYLMYGVNQTSPGLLSILTSMSCL